MTIREEARKQNPMRKNMWQALLDMKLVGYRYYIYLFLDITIQILVPFFMVLIPAGAVELLQNKVSLTLLVSRIVLWIGVILILNLIKTYVHNKLNNMAIVITDVQYWRKLESKVMNCNLKDLESEVERERLHEAMGTIIGNDGMGEFAGIIGLYMYGIAFIVNMGGFLLYATLTGGLNLVLLIVLIITSVVNCYAKSSTIKYQFNNMDKFWENSSRFWYLKKESINTEKTKDIRMYNMYDWFDKALCENTEEATRYYDDIQKHHLYGSVVIKLMAIIRDCFAYGFLIYQLIQGKIEISLFVAYLGVVAGFGVWVSEIVNSYSYLRRINDRIALFNDYVKDIKDIEVIKKGKQNKEKDIRKETETEKCKTVQDSCSTIVFEDVTFGYDDKMIFQNFNLVLQAGEKLALVGINGAGKTTLMKLLCGLYPLNGGRILIHGQDISKMSREKCYKYISILFQDVHVLPFSIGKNVACAWTKEEIEAIDKFDKKNLASIAYSKVDRSTFENNEYKEAKVMECLKKAKLWDKVKDLSKGIHTPLTQILDSAGIRLSGGETQRLMLARALYKDAPILILDEPTAALDPIAESDLYEEYARLCENKISVFISHRLSSTRFCDRIVFLENGKIQEGGTHDELMRKNGHYASMYNIQSHYYQKEMEKNEAGI